MKVDHSTAGDGAKLGLILAVFTGVALTVLAMPALRAQTGRLSIVPVQMRTNSDFPKAIQFFCAKNYEGERCKRDALALQKELARYPVERLGPWVFVLVPSGDWKELVGGKVSDPKSPAITTLENRTTIFEGALFLPSGSRSLELVRRLNVPLDAMLQLAVSHELGHALCHEKNEHRASANGYSLRQGRLPDCYSTQPKRHGPQLAKK